MATHRRMTLLTAGALALAGCSAFEPEPAWGAFTISAEPPPELTVSDLLVHVSYGGCGEAGFGLEQVVSGGLAVLSLRKTTPDEPCDMLLAHWLEFPLAQAVREAAEVRLVGPDGSLRLR